MTDPHPIRPAEGTPADKRPAGSQPVRIFIGLKMAPEIAEQLALLARTIERVPVRFVPAGDIHLTLVPPWNETSVPEAVGKLRMALEGFACFPLAFERLCYGPEPRRPRLLWVECAPNAEIAALRNALLGAFDQTNERPFRPHVTLARIGNNGKAIARKNPIDQTLRLTQCVCSVELFRSPPLGERGYQVIASLPLEERSPTTL
jgi:2'-5' RNA ligase